MLHNIGVLYFKFGYIIVSIITLVLGFIISSDKNRYKIKLFIGVVVILLFGLLMYYFKYFC